MIEICHSRGITSAHLVSHVILAETYGTPKGDPCYSRCLEYAHLTNDAGLAAQLAVLMTSWGERRLRKEISQMGGVLDAIALHTSDRDLETDAGFENIDGNGIVI